MKIFTGNFANLKKYKEANLHPISIALTARYFNGDIYRPLNPDWIFKNDPEPIYTPKYMNKINKLSKEKVIKDLSYISNGKDIVLLCHEKNGKFCHRHLVNDWINGEGEYTKEMVTKAKEVQTSMF